MAVVKWLTCWTFGLRVIVIIIIMFMEEAPFTLSCFQGGPLKTMSMAGLVFFFFFFT